MTGGWNAAAAIRSYEKALCDGGIMTKILVGTYRSRRDADDARERLLERGFNNTQISVEGPGTDEASGAGANASVEAWNAPASEARGLAGVISRMFSGLLPDKADRERYERAVRTGGVLVAVHGLDEGGVERAKPILERHGVVDEHSHASDIGADVAMTGRGPRIYTLPNAPSGWNEASEGERVSSGPRGDPGRPEGLTRGTDELGAAEDRNRIEGDRTGRQR